MISRAQRLHPADDAIVALTDLPAGTAVAVGAEAWTVRETIPAKHKFAGRDLGVGERVVMYGVTVGRTTEAVPAGAWLNTARLVHAADDFSGQNRHIGWTAPDVSPWMGRSFRGYSRPNGPAGTANHWVVIPLVFCENRNLILMREALDRALGIAKTAPYERFARRWVDAWRSGARGQDLASLEMDADPQVKEVRLFPHVDGVKFLLHGLGCGGTRQDAQALCGLLAGYIDHPNVAGATVLSLGCQHAQVAMLEEEIARRRPHFAKPLGIFEQQKAASERDLMEKALRFTLEGVAAANELRREPSPLHDLVLGVECGGSDGFSGLSANPAIGHCADLLVALGGAAVLSEFPELCGVEQSLCDRCVTPELAGRFVDLMRRYQKAAEACNSGFDMNPSPGNIRDGLITDAMKSAGAARKGGTAPIVDVLDYPEPVTRRGGLSLLCTPGNDVESTTALAGSGCTVMLFSTGLGTPTGNPVCPTIKVATNTELAVRMADLIDYDAGPIVSGSKTVAEAGQDLLELTLAVASGEAVPKAIALGQDDFLPWKRGVSL